MDNPNNFSHISSCLNDGMRSRRGLERLLSKRKTQKCASVYIRYCNKEMYPFESGSEVDSDGVTSGAGYTIVKELDGYKLARKQLGLPKPSLGI